LANPSQKRKQSAPEANEEVRRGRHQQVKPPTGLPPVVIGRPIVRPINYLNTQLRQKPLRLVAGLPRRVIHQQNNFPPVTGLLAIASLSISARVGGTIMSRIGAVVVRHVFCLWCTLLI